MDKALLDTDIFNEVLKQRHPNFVQHAADYLSEHGRFSISSVTRYEVLRGLMEKNATAQLSRFHVFCQQTDILAVADDVLDRAASLWVHGRQQGRSPNDADLIIAATAVHHRLTLVMGNTSHFDWIPGLSIGNWRNASLD